MDETVEIVDEGKDDEDVIEADDDDVVEMVVELELDLVLVLVVSGQAFPVQTEGRLEKI